MPPAISNPDGHFEDMSLVSLHDRLLAMQNTNWQFHNEVPFNPAIRLDLFERYITRREQNAVTSWSAKDPRLCLFIPAWQQVLGSQGRYLIVLRHWSASIQSLYRRHARILAAGSSGTIHVDFWRNPALAAKMWQAYNSRILALAEAIPEQVMIISQQALMAGLNVPHQVNQRFTLGLNEQTPSPIKPDLVTNRVDTTIRSLIPAEDMITMESQWQSLLALAEHRSEYEKPEWQTGQTDGVTQALVETLLLQVKTVSIPSDPIILPELDEIPITEWLSLATQSDPLTIEPEQILRKIERDAPFDITVWETYARLMLKNNQILIAERAITRILQLGKSAPYLFMLLGVCREAEFDDAAAEYFYRLAGQRNPQNAVFDVKLANLLMALGRYQEAEHTLGSALLRVQNPPEILARTLANCFDQQGRTRAAIEYLKCWPQSSELLKTQLGALEIKAGDNQGAIRYQMLVRQRLSQPRAIMPILSTLASIPEPASRADLAARLTSEWLTLFSADELRQLWQQSFK
ncbi:tetratricopeptide repeat protein [Nitrosomonas cryotolerans]|nr:tetratricopeptide repeat protein [Nitrosomonas cryotolerans]